MDEQTRTKILQSTSCETGIRKLDPKRLRAQLSRAAPQVDYDRYMRSKAWQIKRRKFLAHFNCQCALCGSKDHLHVHHLHYETLGNERVEDVLVCCRRCHFLVHQEPQTNADERRMGTAN